MTTTQESLSSIQQNMMALGKECPEFMGAFKGLMDSIENKSPMDTKTVELILIGISVSKQCSYCIEIHVAKGLKAGLSRAEILSAAQLAVLMGGGPSLMYTMQVVMKTLDSLEGL
ncbi:MAG: carboxymuconolactone decarboxylase family protein [Planctomycetota bacterium]|nr:MAG: carboxymuconolactone decarboxylase family protein [Planctomycetota bacterium]